MFIILSFSDQRNAPLDLSGDVFTLITPLSEDDCLHSGVIDCCVQCVCECPTWKIVPSTRFDVDSCFLSFFVLS